MTKKTIKTQKELANVLNCEELCVLTKKKDVIGPEPHKKDRSAVKNKSKEKLCPVC